MKKTLAIILSLLMVCAIIPMAIISSADASYATALDVSAYADATEIAHYRGDYASGLFISNDISFDSYDADANDGNGAIVVKRGWYDGQGLMYFNEGLGALAANSTGFRVWVEGGEGANTESTTNLYFVFDTLNEDGTHTAYAATWYSNPEYNVTVPDEGAWVELKWAELSFRESSALNTEKAPISGSGSSVAPSEWLSKVDGIVIAVKGPTGVSSYYSFGDFQFIYEEGTDVPEISTVPTEPEEETTTTTTTTKTPSTTDNAWCYVGYPNGNKVTKVYDKDTYTNSSDALKAAITDFNNGVYSTDCKLNNSDMLVINDNITLTESITLTGSWFCIYNEHSITFNPTDRINDSVAITGSKGTNTVVLMGSKDTAPSVAQNYIPYADSAFFSDCNIQAGGYIAGDLTLKGCQSISKLGNWSSVNITGTLELIGYVKDSYNYKMSGFTLGGYDVSGINTYKSDQSSNPDYYVNFVYPSDFAATVTGDITLPSVTTNISTQSGASIRLNEVNGIRFYTSFTDLTGVEEMGTLIGPANLVGTLEMEDEANGYAVKVEYTASEYWEDNQFVGSIVNIKDANLARSFAARAYVVIDGVTYYSNTTSTRSLAEVADACVADTDYYSTLDADTQVLVNNWAAAND